MIGYDDLLLLEILDRIISIFDGSQNNICRNVLYFSL